MASTARGGTGCRCEDGADDLRENRAAEARRNLQGREGRPEQHTTCHCERSEAILSETASLCSE